MIEMLPLAVAGLLLLAAAASDVATMTIPNWLCAALAAAFPLTAALSGVGWATIGLHILFGFIVLAIGFLLFNLGLFGGGDAKLVAAAAVWTGLGAFPVFILWTALVGGVIALVLLFARRAVKPSEERPAFLNRLLKPRGGVPYGVAIAAGGFIALDIVALTQRAHALTLP